LLLVELHVVEGLQHG
jgi:hypothetical protein